MKVEDGEEGRTDEQQHQCQGRVGGAGVEDGGGGSAQLVS